MPVDVNYDKLAFDIKSWAAELGFTRVGISDIDLCDAEQELRMWLKRGFHGEMHYMEKHGTRRSHPEELIPGTVRVISVAHDYMPEPTSDSLAALSNSEIGFVSRYALGRDYHKVVRKKLQKLADWINSEVESFGYRVFCDSAPVLEKPLARQAGLGWTGKHTNLLNRQQGSYFFLGELYVNIPLPVDRPVSSHCGSCTACIEACPTGAIVEPYRLDARKCISYLTIELHGSIPVEYRPAIGNRIYGCDDCQLVCPWNRYAQISAEPDFLIRHQLHDQALTTLFSWSESTFMKNTEGSAIRRIGYIRWLRNIAVALGNAPYSDSVVDALLTRIDHPSEVVCEHVRWALEQHGQDID
ncbi:MAG: tRNA epoxyqueuosine(34) reductase QueG [Acidiferrobacterales bacterium]|nr:tRNA epoxyqueuosine(34) reductase QueG [Acidiferrobacterales bacterium]